MMCCFTMDSLTESTFDKIKFPVFMHVKPPDDAGLEDLVPTVWWATLENVSFLYKTGPHNVTDNANLQKNWRATLENVSFIYKTGPHNVTQIM